MRIKAMIPIAFSVIGAVAVADESVDPNGQARTENCRAVYDIAKGTMEARQAGVPVTEMVDSAERNLDGAWLDLAKSIILDAYDNPLFSTSPHKERSISEFSNSAYVHCMNS